MERVVRLFKQKVRIRHISVILLITWMFVLVISKGLKLFWV